MAAGFSDVRRTDWFYDAVDYVSENGLMVGTNKGFEPNVETSRAMIWTILARLDGADISSNGGVWYAGAQKWAILQGVSDGTNPDGDITREELAAMLCRYVKGEPNGSIAGYEDVGDVSTWALDAMRWACGTGIISGMNGKLNPQGKATRAQVATMLMRFCQSYRHTVTFELNYDREGVYTILYTTDGGIVSQPKNPTRSGYSFVGWYTRAEGGQKFDFSTKITADLTLYARWSRNASYTGSSGYTHRHSYTGVVTQEATCTETGVMTYTCTCGRSYTDVIPALNHDFQFVTDWSSGNLATAHKCTRCDAAGDQTPADDTYYISSAADLEAFATKANRNMSFSGKTILLTADIDLSGKDWTPINSWAGSNTSNDECFRGTFDGGDHTIRNMTVSANDKAGFFGVLIDGAVKNVKFDNAKVSGHHWGGVVVGYVCDGCPSVSIEHCTVTNSSVTLTAEQVNETWDNGDKAGGIVGYFGTANNAKGVTNCTVKDTTIKGVRDLGGIAGAAGVPVSGCEVSGNNIEFDTTKINRRENKGDVVGRVLTGLTVDGAAYVTAAELNDILIKSNNVTLDKDYEVTNDWAPILISSAYTLDGDGHTITGLTDGLFRSEGNDLTVKGLIVANSNLTAGSYNNGLGVGAIVNYSNSASSLVLENCHAVNVTVTGSTVEDACPGCAGLVGYSDAATTTIKDCSVKNVTVTGHDGNAAGIIGMYGYNNGLNIDSCTVKDVTLTADKNTKIGQIIGSVVYGSATLTRNNVDGKLYGRTVEGTITVDGKTPVADGVALSESGEYEISNANGMVWFANQVNEKSNGFFGKTVKLTADIDLSNQVWTPVGQTGSTTFGGTFDGNGKTISGLTVTSDNSSTTNGYGLFGWLQGTVKDLTVSGAKITASHNVGVIAGYVEYGTISNCTVSGAAITANHVNNDLCGDKVGGIAGYLANQNNSKIQNCKVENTTITAGRDAGQVVGCVYSAAGVDNCSATNVTLIAGSGCAGANMSGIIGRNLNP